ncbi:hypothetical protein J2Z83_000055 [Virgibacillus natechei]|uniref:Uncharacterized protein n=1 Tax=Virgibacillus natechei TaxID=1216297 RepID=A0ABS4IAP1_9BACI|nr:hypothetical protein [Virgibacillus natechei]MBP1967963.1 hypothetical protein [Virgibacillus natechei]UZD14749.1 hypothetical protein OLD84_09715 [Virgibacillus natechei]
MSEENQWYTNKELFEQLNGMRGEFNNLRVEMKETRSLMKQYNGLREEIGIVKEKVEHMEAEKKGRSSVGSGIRNWGGWIISFITLIILLAKFYGGA